MRSGLGSVIAAGAGIVYTVWINIYHSESLADKLVNAVSKPSAEDGFMTSFQQLQVIGVILAVIALYSGVKSAKNKSTLGIVGVIMAVVLLFMIFTPFGQHFADSAQSNI